MRKVTGRVFQERSCLRLEAILLQKPAKFPQELHPEMSFTITNYGFVTTVGDAGA